MCVVIYRGTTAEDRMRTRRRRMGIEDEEEGGGRDVLKCQFLRDLRR